ncbi:hypothetical protein ASPZODRAFT_148862 [Penicilliopsis zonata CBS 506.65]|uniref:Uncharacterized protein n=1 Tax=Penicilliopsis zonata CBS 506.65 TaxID=1073090 RepID=A0A1L9SWV3_9EURO|nr:hypothetical protein ASPZODRAFT_148862 [Penicilliopsis zonata CBS 506.65]OJJ51607.1 hypothetical protein ASPZODRAFT_148862 [Penicilliopsis zonata CBS 506.65]
MIYYRARPPSVSSVRLTSRFVRTRQPFVAGRRAYSNPTPASSGQPGPSSKWPIYSLGLTGAAAVAYGGYKYAVEPGSQVETPTDSAGPAGFKNSPEDMSSLYVQEKKSLKSPGVYLWGSNSHRVVDPESKEAIVKTPRELSDLKISDKSGAAITEKGDLVQWGKGFSEKDFKPTKTLCGKDLISLTMSDDRIIALSSNGSVYSLPVTKNDQQSGQRLREGSWVPFRSGRADVSYRPLEPALKLGEKVTAISGGLEHVLLLTNYGRVFSAAAASESFPSHGQLGIPGLTWANRRKERVDACYEVETLKGLKATQIATGDYHSMILTSDGRVFMFGDNSLGQLGVRFNPTLPYEDTPFSLPLSRLYRDGSLSKVSSIAAGGANSFFTVDVKDIPSSDEKHAPSIRETARNAADTWACGRGIWGSLGNGKWTHIQDSPARVKSLSSLFEFDERARVLSPIRLRDISVGTTHVAAIMDNTSRVGNRSDTSLENAGSWGLDILWWGGNEFFQLGTGKRSNLSKPTHITVPSEAGDKEKHEARLQIMPRHKGAVGNRTLKMEQRVECGRHQKRGRRAADKAKKEQSKRKRDEGAEDPVAKRVKPSAEETTEEAADETAAPDYIPLTVGDEEMVEDGNYDGAPSNDMVFFGLLDTEEQEYFSRANEMLELNQFADDEERSLFIDSVYQEAKGKELKIACSQGCSRLMEKLISLSNVRQLRTLFGKFIGHFQHLVQHRFASHCCETLFIRAAPAVAGKPSKTKGKNSNEDGDGDGEEPELSLAEMFLTVVEELEGNWGYLLTERFASHTIRVLLLVLAGEPVDMSSADSVVASKKKERLGVPGADAQNDKEAEKKREVPESFEQTLKRVMKDMVSGLDDTYLRALATHPVGNPVLQVLLYLELRHFGKTSFKESSSITKRLIPDETFQEGSEGTKFAQGLLYDPVGSRLLETIVRWTPGKLFKSLYKNLFRDRMASLARNVTAGYVAIRILERLGKDDLQSVVDAVAPEIPSLIERSRLAVPRVLVERCAVRGVDTAPLAKAFEAAYDKDPVKRLNQMLRLVASSQDEKLEFQQENQKEGQNGQTPNAAEKLHGSLLVQSLLTVPGPLSEFVFSTLSAQPSETIISLSKDPSASRVLQQALTQPTSSTQFRRQFTVQFCSHLKDLALDSSGSHVVDALWTATKDFYFVKERMAQELLQNEMALRDSFLGRAVWRNWSMDLYKRRPGEWKFKAKGLDQQPDGHSGQGEKPKSRLELARASQIWRLRLQSVAPTKFNRAVEDLIIPFIRTADENPFGETQQNGDLKCQDSRPGASLVEYSRPEELQDILQLELPEKGTRQDGLIEALQKILRHSVNTWHQGFLDKLYASTNAPGLAAELILATLNTNVHVYQVSPVLTIIEKYTVKRLAALFGLDGPYAGGASMQGGSASNTTSIVIARNTLYPSTKQDGNGDRRFVLFTSAHGHYSIEKAAQMLGFGSGAVWSVPVDRRGRLIPTELEKLVQKAQSEGRTPFYVNATAGTTVMGSFDPFHEISAICKRHKLWLHVDGSWGGSFAFSQRQRGKLSGAEKANSIAINPHKMLGAPITCSFLLASDIRQFHRANTLPAGYLFHSDEDGSVSDAATEITADSPPEVWDLADLTLQCGRRADSLKLFLGWTYYGTQGYEQQIDSACEVAAHLATIVDQNPNFILISENPPPCLQVCFYYTPGQQFVYPRSGVVSNEPERGRQNSRVVEQVTRAIVSRGFMVDFAPPSGGDAEAVGNGKFFRCVVNILTSKQTVESLIRAIEETGPEVVEKLKKAESHKPRIGRGWNRPGERGYGPVVHQCDA